MLALAAFSLRCNTNDCPTGVATQDPRLVGGLVVTDKAERVYNYHHDTLKTLMGMVAASGLDIPLSSSPGMSTVASVENPQLFRNVQLPRAGAAARFIGTRILRARTRGGSPRELRQRSEPLKARNQSRRHSTTSPSLIRATRVRLFSAKMCPTSVSPMK